MSNTPKKKTMSKSDRLKLIGLLAVADSQNLALNATAEAIAEHVGFENLDDDDSGWIWDAIHVPLKADALLKKLGIRVR